MTQANVKSTALNKALHHELTGELGAPVVKPNLFEYDNYRKFLKDYYAFKKKTAAAFSYRFFSKKAGYRSTNFLNLVISGKRNLTEDGIERLCRAMNLTSIEGKYFGNLVNFCQASNIETKQKSASDMCRSKVFSHLRPIAKAKFDYWNQWYNVAIREMVVLPGFAENPEWIAKTLQPEITPEQAAQSIENLLLLGLLTRNAAGVLIQADADIWSGNDLFNASLLEFHRQMIQKAREAVDRFPRHLRHVSSVTFALSEETAEKVKDLVNKFRMDLVALADAENRPEKVYQMNFQLFPLTHGVDTWEKK